MSIDLGSHLAGSPRPINESGNLSSRYSQTIQLLNTGALSCWKTICRRAAIGPFSKSSTKSSWGILNNCCHSGAHRWSKDHVGVIQVCHLKHWLAIFAGGFQFSWHAAFYRRCSDRLPHFYGISIHSIRRRRSWSILFIAQLQKFCLISKYWGWNFWCNWILNGWNSYLWRVWCTERIEVSVGTTNFTDIHMRIFNCGLQKLLNIKKRHSWIYLRVQFS